MNIKIKNIEVANFTESNDSPPNNNDSPPNNSNNDANGNNNDPDDGIIIYLVPFVVIVIFLFFVIGILSLWESILLICSTTIFLVLFITAQMRMQGKLKEKAFVDIVYTILKKIPPFNFFLKSKD